MMDSLGGGRSDYVAKVFGGGNMFGVDKDLVQLQIGTSNAEYALEMLEHENIPVVARNLEPESGLKIVMDSGTGEVLTETVNNILGRMSP